MTNSIPPGQLPSEAAQEAEPSDAAQPATPSRRRFLGGLTGLTALSLGADLAGCSTTGEGANSTSAGGLASDAVLRDKVKNVVVLFAENRSFNCLFANFPGVERPLSALPASAGIQRDRDGSVLPFLPPAWGGVIRAEQQFAGVTYPAGVQYETKLPNGPFALKGPGGADLPLELVTRDLWHVFYQNQMQINGGKNDGFVAWADSGGFTMGHYASTAYNLHLWDIAREFTLCDNFFQGAFGGSFLNHQYLVSAAMPVYPDARNSVARSQIATLQSDDPTDTRLKPLPDSPASALQGPPKFGPSAITPDGFAVNTMLPSYAPTPNRDPTRPAYAAPGQPNVLVPQKHKHIGDMLSARGVDWAWYSGAWQATLDGKSNSKGIPEIPSFQYHHQPLNYFEDLGPDHPQARAKHLRDAGLGDSTSTNHFLAEVEAGRLPAVTFYKPQGNLNMHAGYADVASGDRHLAHVIHSLRNSPQWKNMVVVLTVDENGGWWDHVGPPKGDRWGPGTRIPALVISPFARRGVVDHTVYDTGSILRLITRVFGLEKLDGLRLRDETMLARGQKPMGDLTGTLNLG
ncbi:MAG: acid phosphatase [Rhodoferax sp.]